MSVIRRASNRIAQAAARGGRAAGLPRLSSDEPRLLARNRVTAVSRIRGTRRTQKETSGHEGACNRVQEDTKGNAGTREDTTYGRFGTVRPRVQIPGPRPCHVSGHRAGLLQDIVQRPASSEAVVGAC